MADYNWGMQSDVGGYLGENNRPDMSTDNAHQDKSGFKERHDDAQRVGEIFKDTPEPLTDTGDTDRGVGGSKSSYGVSNGGSFVQSQFGLEGTTGSAFGSSGGSDRQLGETNTSSRAATDPSDETTSSGEDGWHPEDLTHTQGSKKDSVMTKIKEKLPGHHNTDVTDPKAAPKKGVIQKIKEKLPGHHSNDAGM